VDVDWGAVGAAPGERIVELGQPLVPVRPRLDDDEIRALADDVRAEVCDCGIGP